MALQIGGQVDARRQRAQIEARSERSRYSLAIRARRPMKAARSLQQRVGFWTVISHQSCSSAARLRGSRTQCATTTHARERVSPRPSSSSLCTGGERARPSKNPPASHIYTCTRGSAAEPEIASSSRRGAAHPPCTSISSAVKADNLHPNSARYEVRASRWYAVIAPCFVRGCPSQAR